MTFTSRDLRDQVERAAGASEGSYDVAAVVAAIQAQHGTVSIETLTPDQFWSIMAKHLLPKPPKRLSEHLHDLGAPIAGAAPHRPTRPEEC